MIYTAKITRHKETEEFTEQIIIEVEADSYDSVYKILQSYFEPTYDKNQIGYFIGEVLRTP